MIKVSSYGHICNASKIANISRITSVRLIRPRKTTFRCSMSCGLQCKTAIASRYIILNVACDCRRQQLLETFTTDDKIIRPTRRIFFPTVAVFSQTMSTTDPSHQMAWSRLQWRSSATYRAPCGFIYRSQTKAGIIQARCQTCCEAQDSVARPSPDWRRPRGRPRTTLIYQICRDTGITVTDALELVEDKSFWRQIATAGGMLRLKATRHDSQWWWWRRRGTAGGSFSTAISVTRLIKKKILGLIRPDLEPCRLFRKESLSSVDKILHKLKPLLSLCCVWCYSVTKYYWNISPQ